MTSEQFTYWLQGYLEISGAKELNKEQIKIVQDHLDLVLTKVTPSYPSSAGLTQQSQLLPAYLQGSTLTC